MKTYTFTLPKNENKSSNLKNMLMRNIAAAYPWMTVDSKVDYPYSNIGIEYAGPNDYITLGTSKTHNVSWCPGNCPLSSICNTNFNQNFDLEKDFNSAILALRAYANKSNPFASINSGYDFIDDYGRPVKIFDNFIQVGYEIIPIAKNSLNYLKTTQKKTIIDITIKLNRNGLL